MPPRQLCFVRFCPLEFSNFFIVQALPFFLVVLFRDPLGMGQGTQLCEVHPPGFFLFRGQRDPMLGFDLCLMSGGSRMRAGRMSMMFCGENRGGGENGKREQDRVKAHGNIITHGRGERQGK